MNKILLLGTPKWDEMMPRTQILSLSEFCIAFGNARQEWGKARKAQVRMSEEPLS